MGFPGGSVVKNLSANAGDTDLIPGLGKIPWRRKWQHTQYSCVEIPWTEEPGRLQSRGWQSRTWQRLKDYKPWLLLSRLCVLNFTDIFTPIILRYFQNSIPRQMREIITYLKWKLPPQTKSTYKYEYTGIRAKPNLFTQLKSIFPDCRWMLSLHSLKYEVRCRSAISLQY